MRQFARIHVLEAQNCFFLIPRKGGPALEAKDRPAGGTGRTTAALGMNDAVPGCHDIDLARADRLDIASAVAVQTSAV